MAIPDRIARIKTSERVRINTSGGRQREILCLIAATFIVSVGLLLVYQGKSAGRDLDGVLSFAETDRALSEKKLLNLNTSPKSTEIFPFLKSIENEADRRFAARKLENVFSSGQTFSSLGALAAIRVSEDELEQSKLKPQWYSKRMEEAKQRRASTASQDVKISLLPQLGELRSHFVVRTPAQFRNQFLLYSVLSCLAFYLVHLFWRRRGFRGDQIVLPALHLLTGLGLIVSISLVDPLRDRLFFPEFAQGTIAGCGIMLLVSLVDFQRSELRKLSFIPLLASFLLSILLIVFGWAPAGSNAKVNLTVGPLTFQPVEVITKLLILFLAGYFATNWEFLREIKENRGTLPWPLRKLHIPKLSYFLPVIAGMVLAVLFFLKQQDLGPALIMYCSFLVLYGVARGRGALMTVGLAMLIASFAVSYRLNEPATIRPRIDMWLSPWNNDSRGGDQVAKSMWALSAGAATGVGVGLSDAGEPGTLPAGHTDLILSVIGEELGFTGVLAVFLLFAIVIHRCLQIAVHASGIYSFFLALGLTVTLVLQTLLISGGALGLVPLSGVITPFLSFGRSAMLLNFMAMGILMAVSNRSSSSERNKVFLPGVRIFACVSALLAAAVLAKAAYVQVFRSDQFLVASANALQADGVSRVQYNPRILRIARSIPKGNIYDRNGIPLATSNWANLEKYRVNFASLNVWIDDLNKTHPERFYPFGPDAFYLLGDQNTKLNWGAPNTRFIERDSLAQLQGFDSYEDLIPLFRYRYYPEHESVIRIRNRNRDVRTSIDIDLQLRVGRILEEQLQKSHVKKGSVVVLDSHTGEILASVSYPVPRAGSETDIIDRARFGILTPGSTFKLVTAIAALRKTSTLREKTFPCGLGNKGGIKLRNWPTIHDDEQDSAHGDPAMQKAITVSCNAYFAQLGTIAVGADSLLSTARAFARFGRTYPDAQTVQSALPFVSFGQNIVVTPFEMALVAATIANGGEIPKGTWISGDESHEMRNFLNQADADFLAQVMRSVVTDGTASDLRDVLPPIAGKTGTAEVENQRSHSWFVGFAPYRPQQNERRIAFSIVIENGGYGNRAAVPVARELVTQLRTLNLIQ